MQALKLEILPKAQRKVWQLLNPIPKEFVLYGGTAIALQLGHRESIDFDFFSSQPLNRNKLINILPFLSNAELVQPEINTLDCYIQDKDGTVKLQFLAGIGSRQGRVENYIISPDNGLQLASLRDLFATKLNTIQMRAESKDYIDIAALLKSKITLADGLACARAIYGKNFDPRTSLRALCSYRDGDLPQLALSIRNFLTETALSIEEIPTVKAISPSI